MTQEKWRQEETENTLKIGVATAMEHDWDLVVATSTGDTLYQLLEIAKEMGSSQRIVAVTHAYGVCAPGKNEISVAMRQELEQQGVTFVTAAHALSGGERGLSKVFGGVYPVEIMAATLRMFGQGVKVCVEISLMALDCGAISFGCPVVAIGGTGQGADTCCVLTPGYTAKLLDTKIHHILCKPSFLEE